jgi:hypothetical protein
MSFCNFDLFLQFYGTVRDDDGTDGGIKALHEKANVPFSSFFEVPGDVDELVAVILDS